MTAAQMDVSRETTEAFATLEQLVHRWTAKINLVSKASLVDIHERHILDSMQLFKYLPAGATLWVDFGSGGGFPGLVIAILAKVRAPALRVTLVESDARKAAFLRTAAQELVLPVRVINDRIESLAPLGADVVSARALAPLPKLLELLQKHVVPGGVAVFPKGASYQSELAEAQEAWTFDCDIHPNETSSEGAILVIKAIKPKGAA